MYLKTSDNNARVQKCRLKLSEYDYEVKYKPGKYNTYVDALSRNFPINNSNDYKIDSLIFKIMF